MNISAHSAITIASNSSIKDYIKLMKPRVMSLVVFTSLCGIILAPGKIHPFLAFVAILCITLGAGSAAAINMWYDRDIDAIMKRTQNRPIVTGAIEANEALSFGIIIAFIAVLLMTLCINILSAILLLVTILYYVFIYTMWLKRTNILNVVIGGVSGAIPPIIGWTSVTNNISLEPLVLFAIIFLWTPPHSWALALYRNEDYKSCNVPMMPLIKGDLYTKKQILVYSILMVFASLAPYLIGMSHIIYLIIATTSGLVFIVMSVSLFNDNNYQRSKKLFIYSIVYLFTIFLGLLI